MLKGRVKQKAKSRIRGAADGPGDHQLLKAAAVGGTAYYAGKKISEKGQEDQDLAAQGESYAPPPQPATGAVADMATQLQKLAHLHDSGILTDEEFAAAKQKVLAI